MSEQEINSIIENADFVVAGYAFTKKEDGFISIVCLDAPHHAAVIDIDGNVIETNMYDIEIDIIVNKYWDLNKKQILDKRYA